MSVRGSALEESLWERLERARGEFAPLNFNRVSSNVLLSGCLVAGLFSATLSETFVVGLQINEFDFVRPVAGRQKGREDDIP